MTVVIDTNVLISAALRDRLPEQVILFVAGRDDIRWLVTPEILNEYTGVLRRPKFSLDEAILARWTELLGLRTVNVGSPPPRPTIPATPRTRRF
jgi:putative PIN family toxin of toxin-antitoxin system